MTRHRARMTRLDVAATPAAPSSGEQPEKTLWRPHVP